MPVAETGAGVALVPRRAADELYPPRFAAMVAACVISSHFPTQMSLFTVQDLSNVASHSVTHSSLKSPESLGHLTK